MGWTLGEVYALPHDVYLEAVAFVNDEVLKPEK
jgi:hypothetical protein